MESLPNLSKSYTKRDASEKEGFALKSSKRVQPDGREKLTGYQWTKRVRELKARAEGWCEATVIIEHPRHYIGDEGDTHHIVKRSKSRDDRLQNLLWVCRAAHNEIHRAG